MTRITSVLFLSLFISSCATILNSNTQKIYIDSGKNIEVVSADSVMKITGEKNFFSLARSSKPVKINLQVGHSDKTVIIKPRSSFAYWLNIYCNLGIGMTIDKDNPKRYAYPKHNYLQWKNDSIILRRFAPRKKKNIDWHFALPHVNYFYLATHNGYRGSGGFMGFESGFDYYYQEDRFVSLYAGAAFNFLVPVPAAVDIRGEYQKSSVIFFSARNNISINRFILGYGLSFSKLDWQLSNNTDSAFIPKSKKGKALGLSFNASYRIGKLFQIGLLYQPYFIDAIQMRRTGYQHQASFELIWKFPL